MLLGLKMISGIVIAFLMGSVVGITLALSGAGGGILAIPLLVFAMHMNMVEAAPISMLMVGTTCATGAFIAFRKKQIYFPAVAIIGAGGFIFSPLGVYLAQKVPNTWLVIIFSVILLLVAIRSFRQFFGKKSDEQSTEHCQKWCPVDSQTNQLKLTPIGVLAMFLTGSIAGFFTGMLGTGGGFIIVPMLVVITNAPMKKIIATSLSVIALVSFSGAVASIQHGNINWDIAAPFVAGGLVAMGIGQLISQKFSDRKFQLIFGMTASIASVLMISRVL